jgi:hypothetical protein
MTSTSLGLKLLRSRTSALIVAAVILAAVALALSRTSPIPSTSTRGSAVIVEGPGYVVTGDPSLYFPSGYYSQNVSLGGLGDGGSVTVGQTTFRLEVPSNLVTSTTVVGGVSTTVVVTVDYQCGQSVGQRFFFHARLANGSDFILDYCLVLNQAASGFEAAGAPQQWSLWQISLGTAPIVAIHMEGTGDNVSTVELCVGK